MNAQEQIDVTVYEQQMGDLSVAAVRKGGEPLCEAVEAAMNVAIRHLGRLRSGALPLTDALRGEIDASLQRAREVLEQAPDR